MDGTHGTAHGAPGRASRPLSEMPASALNRRPAHEVQVASKPLATAKIWDAYGPSVPQLVGQGLMSMTTGPSCTRVHITNNNEVRVNGRTFEIPEGIEQVTTTNGKTFINGRNLQTYARDNDGASLEAQRKREAQRDREAARNRAAEWQREAEREREAQRKREAQLHREAERQREAEGRTITDSFPRPPPTPSKRKPKRPYFSTQPASRLDPSPASLPRQSAGAPASCPPKSRSATALSSSSNSSPAALISRRSVQTSDPSTLSNVSSQHRVSAFSRPPIPKLPAPTATATRHNVKSGTATRASAAPSTNSSRQISHLLREAGAPTKQESPPTAATISRVRSEPGTSTRVSGAPPRLPSPQVTREPGTPARALRTPAKKDSQEPTAARTSLAKAEPGTSLIGIGVAITSARPPGSPTTTSAHLEGQAQLARASQDLLRSADLSAMAPIYLSSDDSSESGPGSSFEEAENEMSFLEMAESQLPNMHRPHATEELNMLLKLPDIDMPPEDRAKTPVQMSITLMEHQKVALKWLKEQENNPSKKGGLLADTMGLGKTIEALALIVAHKPPPFGPKTTLIVAPLALLRQWKREIEDKLKPAHRLTVFIYHGREKKTKKANRLYEYDIVITTYETIAYEHNKRGGGGRATSPLFRDQAGFYRIILDEAHKIKNRKALSSNAVVDLKAEFRLCMTGTPFMNNTSEIFSLVRFLRIAPYCDWKRFSHDIDSPLRNWDDDEKAVPMRKLQVLFRSITLRRSKDSVLDDRPILQLPKLTSTPTMVELDEEQRAYYDAIEKKQQILVNKYLKHNSLRTVYTYILVLLLRLRQVCDHPFLIKTNGIPEEATLSSKQMVSLALRFDPKIVSQVLRKKEFACPVCEDPVEIAIIIYPCGHDLCPECFSTMMQNGGLAKKNGQESQLGLNAFMGGDADMETTCPHNGCETDILPNKVVCHDHFLDAHAPGILSQVQELDTDDDDSDACSSSGDEEDNDSGDDGDDLQDFIVFDGEEDSEVDSDDATEAADNAAQDDGELVAEEEEEEADEADMEDIGARPCQDRESTPFPSDVDGEAERSISEAEVVPELKQANSDFGNDAWGLTLARLRENDAANSDGESQADSDSDLESLSAVFAKAKSTPVSAAAGPSNLPSAKGKRSTNARKMPTTRKRKREQGEEEEWSGVLKKTRQSRKGGKDKKKKKEKKGKGKTLAQLKKAGSNSKAGKLKYFDRLRRDWESSAKVDVTMDLLRKIRCERPHEKTLVFSLWTSFLDLLEIPMQDDKFRYLRYDGGMTFDERDDNVKTFSEDPRQKVLLVSLMAGNAGLNLTAATQIIVIEPFWNPYVEDQAVDRAHRIGQKTEVQVYKLLVPDSVEDRIMELQKKKRSLVSTALSEEGAQGASRLSLNELRGLFGLDSVGSR